MEMTAVSKSIFMAVAVIIISNPAATLWPAFPTSTGSRNSDQDSSQRHRLQSIRVSGSDVSNGCACAGELQALQVRARDNEGKIADLKKQLSETLQLVASLQNSVAAVQTRPTGESEIRPENRTFKYCLI